VLSSGDKSRGRWLDGQCLQSESSAAKCDHVITAEVHTSQEQRSDVLRLAGPRRKLQTPILC
jgi:hypothetical protein